jgi:hypothetical protein
VTFRTSWQSEHYRTEQMKLHPRPRAEQARILKLWIMVPACAVVFATAVLGQTITLFSDNFESYEAGANLAGQGGWAGCGSIPIGTSSALPTKVARADLGSAAGCTDGFARISHSVPGAAAANAVTTLSFDAYAPVGSHDFQILFWDGNSNGVDFFTTNTVPGWWLTVYTNGNGTPVDLRPTIHGGTGAPVSFKIVIDGPNQVVYVIYDFGSGPQTTSTLSLAGNITTLSQWNTVAIDADYRFGLPQGQVDNIRLTQGPPTTGGTCGATDVTAQVTISKGPVFGVPPFVGLYQQAIQIRNGSQPINGPLSFVLHGIPSSTTRLASPSQVTHCFSESEAGDSFFLLDFLLPAANGDVLKAGESLKFTLVYASGQNSPTNFTPKLLSGTLNQ